MACGGVVIHSLPAATSLTSAWSVAHDHRVGGPTGPAHRGWHPTVIVQKRGGDRRHAPQGPGGAWDRRSVGIPGRSLRNIFCIGVPDQYKKYSRDRLPLRLARVRKISFCLIVAKISSSNGIIFCLHWAGGTGHHHRHHHPHNFGSHQRGSASRTTSSSPIGGSPPHRSAKVR